MEWPSEMGANPDYYNTIDQIFHVDWVVAKLARLELVSDAMSVLWPEGHPTRFVHVAGTNGKGSTCRFLEAILGGVGRSGAYLSPHLFDYRERVSVGAEPARPPDITTAWEETVLPYAMRLHRTTGVSLLFPEVSLLVALAVFAQRSIEWAAIEAGLGGRYDQTTALEPEAVVLTNVGKDHLALLGVHTWQRAIDKGGIIRRGVPLVTTERDPATLGILAHLCDRAESPLRIVGKESTEQLRAALPSGLGPTKLLGQGVHLLNAAAALAAANELVPETTFEDAVTQMASVEFLGRFSAASDNIVFDIAHNPDKTTALAAELRGRYPNRDMIVVCGVSSGHPPLDTLRPLIEIASHTIITTSGYRGQSASDVLDIVQSALPATSIETCEVPAEAVERAKGRASAGSLIVVAGSNYLIDDALNPDPYLQHLNATAGWRQL